MYKYTSIIITMAALLIGITGCDKMRNYENAERSAALKMPKDALQVSHRYDIPETNNNDCVIIEEIQPPYYEE